jgi:tellurite resistance protein TehA-like permease
MGFALTWWSFTFPVGTCVTATCQLARHSGLPVFSWLAMVMYVALLGAWLIVLAYTAWGTISGHLLTPKLGTAAPIAKKISD